jgi:hypothetical protein
MVRDRMDSGKWSQCRHRHAVFHHSGYEKLNTDQNK